MLDSALWLLTMTAVVLLVPAFAALLGIERHRHLAAMDDSSRRVRLVVAATLVGVAALGVAALLEADAFTAVVVAVVLAGSVLAWAPLSSTWAVRGVVMWALLVTGAVAFLGWIVQQVVATNMDAAQLVVTAAVGLLLVIALSRGQRYVRETIGAQAGLEPSAGRQPIPVLRPVAALAALLAAGGVVVAVAEDNGGSATSPQAGETGSSTIAPGTGTGTGPTAGLASSAPTPTLGLAPVGPSAVDAGIVAVATRGGLGVTGGLLPGAVEGVPVSSYPSGVDGTIAAWPVPEGGGPVPSDAPPGSGSGGPGTSTTGGSGSGGAGSGGGSGASGPGSTGGTAGGGTGSGGTGAGSGSGTGGAGTGTGSTGGSGSSGGSTGGTGDTGSGVTGSGDVPTGTGSDGGTVTTPPVIDDQIRTPGYAKPKPHRPLDAPSPGHGRLNHFGDPTPLPSPTPLSPSTVSLFAVTPTLSSLPSPTPLLPSAQPPLTVLPAQPTKTPGWAKEKPNRP